HEILAVARSAGLLPLSKPVLKGKNYLLRAFDEDGQEVRVVVDGRAGEVVSIVPVTYSPRDVVRGGQPSVFDSRSPVYQARPPAHRSPMPNIIEDEPEPPPVLRAAPPTPVLVPPPVERDAVIVPAPPPPAIMPPPRAVYAPPPPVYQPPPPSPAVAPPPATN